MKKGIHPKYEEAVIKCACGNEITTKTTVTNNAGGDMFQLPSVLYQETKDCRQCWSC